MAELAGLLLGVTGPVQQVVDILKDLNERLDAVRKHKPLLESLYTRFARLSDTLSGIEEPKINGITDDATRAQLQAMMEHVKNVVDRTVANVAEVKRYAASRFNRFRSAKKHAELIGTIDRDATDCDRYVSDILLLLSQADTHNAVLDIRPGSPGTFEASFAVSKNDRVVYHDFESRRSDGSFETAEGRLKDLIMEPTDDRAVGVVAFGTGGVGKTCALLQIAQHTDVKARFPGGTYFYRLGRDARKEEVISMLADFVHASNGRELAARMRAQRNLHAVMNDACNWFNDRVCLFVVDDFWETALMPRSIIQDLSRLGGGDSGGGAGSRIAYSTRQTEVSDAAGGLTVRFVPREPLGDTARAMLFTAAQIDSRYAHEAQFKVHVDEILCFCAGLPFTLSLAGRLISKIHREWGAEIREETFKICAEKMSGILNVRGESYFQILQISIDHVQSVRGDHMSYTDAVESFCVLRKQDWVPISVCRHMWRVSSLKDAEEVTDILSTLGIVETEYRKIEKRNVRGLRFHDHVHSYALWLAERSSDRTRWFKQVVRSFKSSFSSLPGGTCWPAMLEEDGYAVQNICRVMLGAGLADEVAKTLCTGQWVTKMMHTGQIVQYEADVKDWTVYTENSRTTRNDDVRSALRSLVKIVCLGHPDCVGHVHVAWFQLYARLRSVRAPKAWMTTIMREAEKHAPRPFVQARSACLHFPSDAMLEVHRFKFPVCYARWLSDGKLAICAVENSGAGMTAAFLEPGMLPIEKELGTADLFDPERHDTVVCLSPNGAFIFSGHSDGTIRTWDVTTGKQVNTWHKGNNSPISAICICGDGSRVASRSKDGMVRIWDVASGALVCDALDGQQEFVTSVSMSENGSRVASISFLVVRVWDIASGAPVCYVLNTHLGLWECVSLSGDGSRVAAGLSDGEVYVWDVVTGAQVCDALTGHTNAVESVSMSYDGSRVASGSYDGTVRVWDVASGALVCDAFTGHEGFVTVVCMSGDGSRVASGSEDRTVRVWDIASGASVCNELTGHEELVTNVSMSADGSHAASGSLDETVRVWDVASGAPVCDPLTSPGLMVLGVSMSGDGSHVATGWIDDTVRVHDLRFDPPVCKALTGHTEVVWGVNMNGDGSCVASGSEDRSVRVWDVATGAPVCDALNGHEGFVRTVSMSCDGSRVASGSEDRTVRVWDVATGAPVCDTLTGHEDVVSSVIMSGDGNRVVSVSDDRTSRLWSAVCGKCEKVMPYDDAESRAAADAAGRRFLRGRTRPALNIAHCERFVVIADGVLLRVAAFGDRIVNFSVSDDGKQVVAGFQDGVVALLHVLT